MTGDTQKSRQAVAESRKRDDYHIRHPAQMSQRKSFHKYVHVSTSIDKVLGTPEIRGLPHNTPTD